MEGLREMNFLGVQGGELSDAQKSTLFERMKYVVVSVEVYSNEHREFDCEGTGVFISDSGHVLTLSHVFGDDHNANVRVITIDKVKHACCIIKVNKAKGLAILQVKNTRANTEFPYARIYGGEVQNGENIYSIGHSHYLDYSYSVGRISCPHRLYGDVRSAIEEGRKRRSDLREIEDTSGQYLGYVDNLAELHLKSSVSLVQVNNIHGDGMGGSSGMPIFNCQGHIIGLYIFLAFDQCFGIQACELRSYVSGIEQASTSGSGI